VHGLRQGLPVYRVLFRRNERPLPALAELERALAEEAPGAAADNRR
jgi:hypothetical protein